MARNRMCDNFIFDLGDILQWSLSPHPAIPVRTMQRMMQSAPFFDYERGRLGEDQLYTRLSSLFSLPRSHVADFLNAIRTGRKVAEPVVRCIRRLRAAGAGLQVYGAWNISAPDWEFLLHTALSDVLTEFDQVYPSARTGERMSGLAFYRHLPESISQNPSRCAFISSTVDHVIAATSLGMVGVHFKSEEVADLERSLNALVRDAVFDGERYLRDHAGRMWSTTNTGVEVQESYAQLLILEVTRNPRLVNLPSPQRRMHFFAGAPVLTTKDFPADVDTTSIACTAMGDRFTKDLKNSIMDDILTVRDEDGLPFVYYDDQVRPRIDHVVCINVLTLFHSHGRASELPQMLDWVYNILKTRAYAWGTRYYIGADLFLYFLSRLIAVPAPIPRHADIAALFKERVMERFGEPGDASAVAMRLFVAGAVGLQDRRGYDQLLKMQEPDGSWPSGWIYSYGVSPILIGNKGLTTAIAVAAIRRFRELSDEY